MRRRFDLFDAYVVQLLMPTYPGTILKQGSSGDAVALIQKVLGVQQTGTYGPTTEANVSKFQRARELQVDGQVGPLTWAALFAPSAAPTTDLGATALVLALTHVGQHEQPLGSNRGPQVSEWLKRTGGEPGNPWCASFACCMIEDAAKQLGIPNPVPMTASSSALYRWAKGANRLVARPEPGDLALVIGGETGHYHTVICAGVPSGDRVQTIEGNSNMDGSANGVEVAHRAPGRRLSSCDFVRI